MALKGTLANAEARTQFLKGAIADFPKAPAPQPRRTSDRRVYLRFSVIFDHTKNELVPPEFVSSDGPPIDETVV